MKPSKSVRAFMDYIVSLEQAVAVLEAENKLLTRRIERMLVTYGAMVRKVRKLKR